MGGQQQNKNAAISGIAQHEILINKKLIEDIEKGQGPPGSPNTIKRPFWAYVV